LTCALTDAEKMMKKENKIELKKIRLVM